MCSNTNNDDDDNSFYCLVTSLPSTSGVPSVHDPTAEGYGEDEGRRLSIQYALSLINGNQISYFVHYKDP